MKRLTSSSTFTDVLCRNIKIQKWNYFGCHRSSNKLCIFEVISFPVTQFILKIMMSFEVASCKLKFSRLHIGSWSINDRIISILVQYNSNNDPRDFIIAFFPDRQIRLYLLSIESLGTDSRHYRYKWSLIFHSHFCNEKESLHLSSDKIIGVLLDADLTPCKE